MMFYGRTLVSFLYLFKISLISYFLTYQRSEMGSIFCFKSVTKLVLSGTDLSKVAFFFFYITVAQYRIWTIKVHGNISDT